MSEKGLLIKEPTTGAAIAVKEAKEKDLFGNIRNVQMMTDAVQHKIADMYWFGVDVTPLYLPFWKSADNGFFTYDTVADPRAATLLDEDVAQGSVLNKLALNRMTGTSDGAFHYIPPYKLQYGMFIGPDTITWILDAVGGLRLRIFHNGTLTYSKTVGFVLSNNLTVPLEYVNPISGVVIDDLSWWGFNKPTTYAITTYNQPNSGKVNIPKGFLKLIDTRDLSKFLVTINAGGNDCTKIDKLIVVPVAFSYYEADPGLLADHPHMADYLHRLYPVTPLEPIVISGTALTHGSLMDPDKSEIYVSKIVESCGADAVGFLVKEFSFIGDEVQDPWVWIGLSPL